MARVTAEDCLKKIPNRFALVCFASERTRQLVDGAPSTIIADDAKLTVTALREIAQGTLDIEALKKSIEKRFRSPYEQDETDAEIEQMLREEGVVFENVPAGADHLMIQYEEDLLQGAAEESPYVEGDDEEEDNEPFPEEKDTLIA